MAIIRPRLGEILQAQGICTREQLREAWEAKVLYGDRLGTNLLALGLVDEPTLARVLGEQLGVHSGHGKVIKIEATALKLVPRSVAEKRSVVPHHVGDKQLFLLMKDPNDPVAIDEVRFACGLKIMPVVVCEARIWELLERHYGVNASMRPVPFLDGRRRSAGSPPPPAAVPSDTSTRELTSEDDFHQLYAGMHTGAPISLSDGAPVEETPPAAPIPSLHAPIAALDDGDRFGVATNPGRPLAILAARDPAGAASFLAPPRTDAGESLEWREALETTRQPPRPDDVATAATAAVAGAAPVIDLLELDEVAQGAALVRLETLEFHVEVAAVVDESPLSFADASEMLKGAADRNAIAKVVLRAARTRFARACLLTVYSDRIVGWMGLGDGMETDRLRAIALSRAERSVFSFVVDSRAHYLGPLAKWPAHGTWVKATGRQIPRSLAVFPILVRGRAVNVLVVDNGHDRHVDNDVGELLILAQQIAKTYETLLRSGS